MIRIRMMASGEEVCVLPASNVHSMFAESGCSLKALKQHLHSLCGTPRFRQRLICPLGEELTDGTSFEMFRDLNLVLLPLCQTSMDQADDLVAAAKQGAVATVEAMLTACQDPNQTDRAGWSALLGAAGAGAQGSVELLLEAGADKNGLCTHDGTTPLMLAAVSGHLDIVRTLLRASADKDQSADDGATPLFLAAQAGHQEVARLLLDSKAEVTRPAPMTAQRLNASCGSSLRGQFGC